MKIVTNPTVYVMGRQTIDGTEINEFLLDHGVAWETDTEIAAEQLVETAGRVCYMSFAKPRPGGNKAYIDHIIEVGHGSVLEHAVWNILIVGVSRSLSHELVRHRAGFGFSQLSQRYVDESVAEYIEPDIIANYPHLHAIWKDVVLHTHEAYVMLADGLNAKLIPAAYDDENEARPVDMTIEEMQKALKPETRTAVRKNARQAARSVLPNATETKIFITANARALRHFIELRGSRQAEPEIRKLANMLLDTMRLESPVLFGDYTTELLPDGTREITTKHKKV